MKLVYFLQGKKTYLVAFVAVVVNACVAKGWITPAHLTQINVILGALGLGAIRAAVSKVQ